MSKENAMRFFILLERKSDLKDKYLSIVNEMENLDEAKRDKLIELQILPMATEAGFEFSIANFKEFLVSISTGELADDELEQVVGGYVQVRVNACVHCFKLDDASLVQKAINSNGFDYVCPSYKYHPHYGMTNTCESCEYGYVGNTHTS
jgi:hypothetical protein